MSELSDFPDFSHEWSGPIEEGQHVYVIDTNGYDIYEGIIKRIVEYDGSISRYTDYLDKNPKSKTPFHIIVHYPEYEVDEDITERSHILWCNSHNQQIFEHQERVRLQQSSTTSESTSTATTTTNSTNATRNHSGPVSESEIQDVNQQESNINEQIKQDNDKDQTKNNNNQRDNNKVVPRKRRLIIYKNSSDFSSSSSGTESGNESSDNPQTNHKHSSSSSSQQNKSKDLSLKSTHRPPEQPIIQIQSSKRTRNTKTQPPTDPLISSDNKPKINSSTSPNITTQMVPLTIENFTSSDLKLSPSDIRVKAERDSKTKEIVFTFNINFQQE